MEFGSERFETKHKRKDGSIFEVEVSIHLLGKDRVVGFFQDITTRKQMEQRLRQREKMDAIGQLAGGIAHDFNNQLATILGYSEMISDNIDRPDIKRYADNIQEAGKRSATLIKQLLAFARKSETVIVPVDAIKLLRGVADIAERTFDKRIRVFFSFDGDATIAGDEALLHNAILNLAINARDAMPEGGLLSITAEHTNHCSEIDSKYGCLKIIVSDTGIGMSEETKSRLFEPFFTTKGVKGTGLGLASVYGTIMTHKGSIKVESELGKGSKFIICLPIKRAGTRIVITKKEPVMAVSPHIIMVVDDEERVRMLLKDMLEGLGYTVVAYEDPADALHFYRHDHERVALSMIDMTMPTMDGASLFAAMKNVNPHTKVIIVSGHSFNDDIQVVVNSGALGYIMKPFDLITISKKVAEAIAMEKK
jgi:nitrogen-specific signal transduction histidine kinase/ActR/RegA family two-component response regulator